MISNIPTCNISTLRVERDLQASGPSSSLLGTTRCLRALDHSRVTAIDALRGPLPGAGLSRAGEQHLRLCPRRPRPAEQSSVIDDHKQLHRQTSDLDISLAVTANGVPALPCPSPGTLLQHRTPSSLLNKHHDGRLPAMCVV